MLGLILLGVMGVIVLIVFGILALFIVPIIFAWIPIVTVGIIIGVVSGIRGIAGLAWFIAIGVVSLLKTIFHILF